MGPARDISGTLQLQGVHKFGDASRAPQTVSA